MDNQEHDRRIIDILWYIDRVAGPLATFREVTKHRLSITLKDVPPNVRQLLIRPQLKKAGVKHTLVQKPVYAYAQRRHKKSPELYMQRNRVGTVWVLRFDMKSIQPRLVVVEEAGELTATTGRNARPSSLLYYSIIYSNGYDKKLHECKSGELDCGDLAEKLSKHLQRRGGGTCSGRLFNSFRGVS